MDVAAEDHVDRALAAHHGNLGGRPGQRDVGPKVLRVHHDVRPAVGLARDDRDAGDRGLGERIEELRPAADHASVLLGRPRQESRHVDEREDREVEGVAEPYEPGGLLARLVVEGAGQHLGLVGDDADAAPVHPGQADDHVRRPEREHLEELEPSTDHRYSNYTKGH